MRHIEFARESCNFKEPGCIKKPQPIVLTEKAGLRSIIDKQKQPDARWLINNSKEYAERNAEIGKKKQFRCNCKKSKCLKLYCECFANGEYCVDCNCRDCSNVLGNEQEIEEVFASVKDKNPVAIKLHSANEESSEAKFGCNCTKSNCLKKYCECFKANVKCTDLCRCRECANSDLSALKGVYDDFVMDKISILIEHSQIFVRKMRVADIDNYYSDTIPDKSCTEVSVKVKGESVVLEIPKSIIKHSPGKELEKLLKRKRTMSVESGNSSLSLNQAKGLSNTACQTSRKVSMRKGMDRLVGKKLVLD